MIFYRKMYFPSVLRFCQTNSLKVASRVVHLQSCKLQTSNQDHRNMQKSNALLTKTINFTQLAAKTFCDKTNFKENIFTIPNGLCILRIAGSPVLGYLIISNQYTAALILAMVFGSTDMLDGYIARNFRNQSSYLGTALDPLADKILITILFVTLAYVNLMPVWLTSLVICRDVCLLLGGFYLRYATIDPPRTVSKYFDISRPTVQMKPTVISKINTVVQLVMVSATLASPVFDFVGHPGLQLGWLITATTTVFSGLGYLSIKDHFTKIKK